MELSETVAALCQRRDATVKDRRFRVCWLLAISIALLHGFMAVTAINTKSPTFDEPQHLAAGFSYWVRNDFRLDPENGNLIARWAALPLLSARTRFLPPNDSAWQYADEGATAHRFLYELGNDPDRMLAQARLMMSIFGIGVCLLVYRIAREFFGGIGGLIAETLAAFDPNFLAHSALVTSDVAAAFFFTATIWSCWRLFQKISPARLTFAGLSLSGLFLTKFSAPIILPVVVIMLIWPIFSHQEIPLELFKFRVFVSTRWKKAFALVGAALFLGGTAVFAIWLSFSFRYSALTEIGPSREVWNDRWEAVLLDHTGIQNAIRYARARHLLPEAYLCGLAYTQKSAETRPAFLDGSWSIVGFASFFPRTFLYKTPLPILLLLLVAILTAITRWNKSPESQEPTWLTNPLLSFACIYGALAISSSLNIGHRHILPIYPAVFVGCGAVASLLQRNRRTILAAAVAVLLLWQIGESLVIRPDYLAYFNQIAGGPSRGYHHLVDSSLDWGQDLPTLKRWIDNHSQVVDGKPLYLGYFGVADPRWYDLDAKRLPEDHLSGDRSFAPLRAGIYCVSATTLQSVYAPEIGLWARAYEQRYQAALAERELYRATASNSAERVALVANAGAVPWLKKNRTFERLRFERLCAYLRHRRPAAQAGYSIFIFDLTEKELNQALYGPPAELTQEISVVGY